MSTDQDYDYMSDVFLQEVEPSEGLVKSRSLKRTLEMSKKKTTMDEENRKKNRPITQIEASNRQVGLNEPLNEENKGFSLLKKMGFEPGKGLGKAGDGRVDPVGLEIKDDRAGLGRKTELLEKVDEVKNHLKGARLAEGDVEEYRRRMVDEAMARQTLADLCTSQRICHQLDLAHGLSQPDEEWFWPPKEINVEEEKEEENESEPDNQITVVNKLKLVTEYLREVHYYCIWCGTRYRGEIDMTSQCPGDTRDQH